MEGFAVTRGPMSTMSKPGYRDEHAALLARQAALEAEIAHLKAEAEGRAPPGQHGRTVSPPKNRTLPLIVGVMTGVLAAGVGAAVARRPARTREVAPVFSIQASWRARVTDASGAAGVSPGATCQIGARIDYRGQALQGVREIVVTCDGVKLYSQRAAAATGTALTVTSDASHNDGRYDVSFDEQGPRTRPHPYASIDTARGIGLISGEAPRMSVDLAIEPGSLMP